MKQATATEIAKQAESEGMINMREDGYLKALDGRTSLAEVNRVAAEDNA
jgi:type II secretory ATPase GspE/PulE/Tfp pilus assembly ATPase PilB-like protein